jgi:HlyD family secretion protein
MKRVTKAFLIGGGVVLAGLGVVAALRPAPVPVETARAAIGPMQVTVDEEGETRVRDRYVVAAPVAARVSRIELREGDSVTAGTVVAYVHPPPLDERARDQAAARVAQAEDAQRAAAAGAARARAALDQAQRSCRRTQQLATQGLVAAEERERAELEETARARDLEAADFQAQAAAHDVAAARAVLQAGAGRPIALRSPLSGRVLRIPERSERVVPAGTPLIELGDPTKLEVVADLLSSDAVQVSCGDAMLIEGWGGGTLHGRLRLVEPSGFTKLSALGVEEQRVNVVGDLLDAPTALGDRYRVDVRVVVWSSPGVLQVPASALSRAGEGWAVFVVERGRARLRPVTIGHRTAFEAEVTAGLADGVRVIRNPSDRIADGVRVEEAR